jgi:hypothetical protein
MSGDATHIGGSAAAFCRLDSAETCTNAALRVRTRKIETYATNQSRRLF